MKSPCPCVQQARDLNREAVVWQKFGYYQHSEPLFRQVRGLMRAARCRAEFMRRAVNQTENQARGNK